MGLEDTVRANLRVSNPALLGFWKTSVFLCGDPKDGLRPGDPLTDPYSTGPRGPFGASQGAQACHPPGLSHAARVFNGKWCEEGVMITHTPLLREASLFRSVGPATVPGPERQGTKQRFWSLGKELISTPPDVQGEEGNSPWLSVSWQSLRESALEAQFLLPASLSCASSSQAVALLATMMGGGAGEGNAPPLLSSSIK